MSRYVIPFTLVILMILGALVAALSAASGDGIAYLPLVLGEGQATPIDATLTPPPPITDTPTVTVTPTATATATATTTATSTPTATATATDVATATPTPTATATPPPPPEGDNVVCAYDGATQICAWVSNATPRQSSNVTVFGRLIVNGSPVKGADVHTEWRFKSHTATRDCRTAADGIGKCARNIGVATPDYRVDVLVEITLDGATYTAETWFVPRK